MKRKNTNLAKLAQPSENPNRDAMTRQVEKATQACDQAHKATTRTFLGVIMLSIGLFLIVFKISTISQLGLIAYALLFFIGLSFIVLNISSSLKANTLHRDWLRAFHSRDLVSTFLAYNPDLIPQPLSSEALAFIAEEQARINHHHNQKDTTAEELKAEYLKVRQSGRNLNLIG